jgi:hypothetical protein
MKITVRATLPAGKRSGVLGPHNDVSRHLRPRDIQRYNGPYARLQLALRPAGSRAGRDGYRLGRGVRPWAGV